MITYKVTFRGNRLGRSRDVDPFTTTVEDLDHLAEMIYDKALDHLLSQDIDVDIEDDHGWVVVGSFRTVAEFDLEIISQPVTP